MMNGKNEEANVWSWRTVAQLFGTHYKISEAPAKDGPAIMWRVNYYDRGTSPYPNHGEAQAVESPKDFIHKLRISLKELKRSPAVGPVNWKGFFA